MRTGVHFVLALLATLFGGVVILMATMAVSEPTACPDGSVKTFHHGEWLCTVPPLEKRKP